MFLHDLQQELFLFLLIGQDSIECLNQGQPSLSCIVDNIQTSHFPLAINVNFVSAPCIWTVQEELLWHIQGHEKLLGVL